MKKFAAIALLLALGTSTAAPANNHFSTTGHILVGTIFGIGSDLTALCDAGSEFNGIDGRYFDIGSRAGQTITVVPTGGNAALQDLAIRFWDAACDDSPGSIDQAGMGATESGTVPPGGRYAFVYLFSGANASFSITVQ